MAQSTLRLASAYATGAASKRMQNTDAEHTGIVQGRGRDGSLSSLGIGVLIKTSLVSQRASPSNQRPGDHSRTPASL